MNQAQQAQQARCPYCGADMGGWTVKSHTADCPYPREFAEAIRNNPLSTAHTGLANALRWNEPRYCEHCPRPETGEGCSICGRPGNGQTEEKINMTQDRRDRRDRRDKNTLTRQERERLALVAAQASGWIPKRVPYPALVPSWRVGGVVAAAIRRERAWAGAYSRVGQILARVLDATVRQLVRQEQGPALPGDWRATR